MKFQYNIFWLIAIALLDSAKPAVLACLFLGIS